MDQMLGFDIFSLSKNILYDNSNLNMGRIVELFKNKEYDKDNVLYPIRLTTFPFNNNKEEIELEMQEENYAIFRDKSEGSRFFLKSLDKGNKRYPREFFFSNFLYHPYINQLVCYKNDKEIKIGTKLQPNYSLSVANKNIFYTDIMKIFWKVTIGLSFMHNKCAIHRDIKPDNIFMNQFFEPFIGDFGHSRDSDVSKTVTMSGTEGFVAPEIRNREKRINERVDTFSLFKSFTYIIVKNVLDFYLNIKLEELQKIMKNISPRFTKKLIKWNSIIDDKTQRDFKMPQFRFFLKDISEEVKDTLHAFEKANTAEDLNRVKSKYENVHMQNIFEKTYTVKYQREFENNLMKRINKIFMDKSKEVRDCIFDIARNDFLLDTAINEWYYYGKKQVFDLKSIINIENDTMIKKKFVKTRYNYKSFRLHVTLVSPFSSIYNEGEGEEVLQLMNITTYKASLLAKKGCSGLYNIVFNDNGMIVVGQYFLYDEIVAAKNYGYGSTYERAISNFDKTDRKEVIGEEELMIGNTYEYEGSIFSEILPERIIAINGNKKEVVVKKGAQLNAIGIVKVEHKNFKLFYGDDEIYRSEEVGSKLKVCVNVMRKIKLYDVLLPCEEEELLEVVGRRSSTGMMRYITVKKKE